MSTPNGDANAGNSTGSDGTATPAANAQQVLPQSVPTNPVQQPAQPASAGGTDPFAALATTLNALPERVANAVREAMPQTPPPAPPAPVQSASSDGNGSGDAGASSTPAQGGNAGGNAGTAASAERRPGAQTFAEWWFGK